MRINKIPWSEREKIKGRVIFDDDAAPGSIGFRIRLVKWDGGERGMPNFSMQEKKRGRKNAQNPESSRGCTEGES